jgi:uncharacterized protein (TIGR02172 family)
MENKTVVGLGRTAEVLAWEQGKVIKLYYPQYPHSLAEHEAQVAEAINMTGLPAPKFYGMAEVGGRPGLIYERISGPTMSEWVQKGPWRLFSMARLLAKLHVQIHRLPATGVSSQRKRVQDKINHADLLPVDQKEKALQILERLPDGDRLCHGDFHPGNIIMTPCGPRVIDWVDVTAGNPLADVDRTALLIRSAYIPPDFPGGRLIVLFRRSIHDIYLRTYTRLTKARLVEIRAWDYPLAAARLEENIVEENDTLLEFLSRAERNQ